ncbi:hypothetical protein I79_018837 [Cricetulus griseus]|uniref:Uncharacterized protein n=1 Tax=Cricetulus griseus TaxID=10029 RepID=G3I5T0_CRIGR|nr:hypothetical protein I79_018837 [Cricetulus griseus]
MWVLWKSSQCSQILSSLSRCVLKADHLGEGTRGSGPMTSSSSPLTTKPELASKPPSYHI